MEWRGATEPEFPKITPLQWPRLILRLVAMGLATVLIIAFYVLFVGLEKLQPRLKVTEIIAQFWGRVGLFLCGINFELVGKHMQHGGAVVANHVSWLDIFTLHSASKISFVAKENVRHWPVIGALARVTGTLFIERRPSQARKHLDALHKRIVAGDKLCFFPEATSTDGQRVIPFKSTLFAVFHSPELIDDVWVQPATVSYFAPKGQPSNLYGWWGDMGFGAHALTILARSRGGRVKVTLHDPVKASDFASRKALAKYCEDVVRAGFEADKETGCAD